MAAAPGGEPQVLLRRSSSYAINLAADAPGWIWAFRYRLDAGVYPDQHGTWRVRTDGTGGREVLPAGRKGRHDDVIAVSADGRSVAIDNVVVNDTDSAYPLLARFDGGPVTRMRYLRPFGFDARGRLIGMYRVVQAYDPTTDRLTPLARYGETRAVVTPHGQFIALDVAYRHRRE